MTRNGFRVIRVIRGIVFFPVDCVTIAAMKLHQFQSSSSVKVIALWLLILAAAVGVYQHFRG